MALKEYWFPWYPSRFKADTMHLTALQDGIYRRLIDFYMETKLPLPDNDLALARIAGVAPDDFVENSGIIRGFFFPAKDGRLVHKKCDEILKKQNKISKKRAFVGGKGGKAKHKNYTPKQEDSEDALPIAKAKANQKLKQNLAHNITEHNKTEKESKGDSTLKSESKLSDSESSKSAKARKESFSIEKFVKDEDRDALRAAAPGWDPYFLFREFDGRVKSGRFAEPDYPVAAFLKWAKNFTKGKKPT